MSFFSDTKFNIKAYRLYRRLKDRSLSIRPNRRCLVPINLELIAKRYNTVIVHAGLRAISARSSSEAFLKIIDSLTNVQTLCIPAFTPSFRKSGVFSVQFSRPEVGSLSTQAWLSRPSRTLDPIHSLFVMNGRLDFDCTLDDTFHPSGIFKNFAQESSCIINIGTPYFVSTNLHYVERVANVPYVKQQLHKGVVLLDGQEPFHVNHNSYIFNFPIAWNRNKIESFLIRNNAITVGLWNSAFCRVVNCKKASDLLINKLESDPYFMVSF